MERINKERPDLVAKLFMVSPANEIANIIDQPQIASDITAMRLRSAGIEVTSEIINAFSTFALLNIVRNPGLYGASVGAEIATNVAHYKQNRSFKEVVLSEVRNKLVQLTPFIGLINTELIDQGYTEAYHWELWYGINRTEGKKLGLQKNLTLSRPILQSISTSENIPLPLAVAGIIASYALIPLFNKFGKDKSKINDKIGFVGEGRDRATFYGAKSIKEPLDNLRKRLWQIVERQQYTQILLDKLPQIGFFTASLIAKTDSFGIFRYLQQLYSTPNSYGDLKESELDTLKTLGYIKSMHEIMSGKPYFLTSSSWDKYRKEKLKSLGEILQTNAIPGIKISNLSTLIPDKSMSRFTRPLRIEAERGEVVLLNGESGTGKSVTTGLGLAGLVETKGSFIFIDKNGSSQYLESFSKHEISRRVWYVAPSHGYDEIRVCDIYQGRAIRKYCETSNSNQKDLTEMELLMLSLPDTLLEKELYAMAKRISESNKERTQFYGYDHPETKKIILNGVEPVFPDEMFDQIHNFRCMRNDLVEKLLKKRGSNFESIQANEPIGHLSTGMRVRFLWELHNELNIENNIKDDETHVVIIDEPFGNLDKKNASEYLELIDEITNKPNPPIIILISHTHQDMIRSKLNNKIVEANFN